MRILIAVPCMDSVPSQFAQSLATLNKVEECVVAFQMGSLIYNSRNYLATAAVKMEADYILWLDSDMVFSSDLLQKLWQDRDKGDIITGVYYRRVEPYKPVLFSKLDIENDVCTWEGYDDFPQDDLFEVEGCGFGAVLTPTNVFVDVINRFGNMFSPLAGVGEDLSFCWRARQCGYNIVADPRIPLGHVGHYVVDRKFFDAYNSAKGKK